MNFKQFLQQLEEGLFIADDKAEEGKSRPKKPPTKGTAVPVSGVSGGPGGGASAGVAAPAPAK